ncbi:50S ribosomal protein L16 [Candidatus Woesearchaeota archaeon]|nr:50S ribosomal protein L16 [Candidatus Woesearchaeota archaeon]
MAKIRKFCAYRRLERPYTRKSKYRKLSFIKSTPHSKIVRFECGNLKDKFEKKVDLVSKNALQIRHNAIESARLSSNRMLEKNLGKVGFRLSIRIYPHHVLRENPLASGAGADRMSTGMKMSFGKPIGSAARVKEGQTLLTVSVNKNNVDLAKKALKRASYKFPCPCSIVVR